MSYIQRSDIESHIVRRAWNDENFLRELRDDPKGVLIREFNMEGLPDQLQINVHVESDDELHLVIPEAPEEEWMAQAVMSGGLAIVTPEEIEQSAAQAGEAATHGGRWCVNTLAGCTYACWSD